MALRVQVSKLGQKKRTLRMVMRTIKGGTAMSLAVVRSRNVLKRNALRFTAALGSASQLCGRSERGSDSSNDVELNNFFAER